ncbi:hypothetical protein HFN89_02930 [Rhizobium laguerreae]|nr:hypothetical protein [Rhizobium laguerreae]
MAKEKKAKPPKAPKKTRVVQPMSVLLGWLEADSAKDARSYARGIIQQRFKAIDESWYAILPFHGGFLWEAHQGGDGKGYIKSAAKALEDDPGGEYWFKAGDRAYRVVMQDGKPFPHLLPHDKSVEILNSGTESLTRTHSMTPYVRKGTGWLVTGGIMAGSSALFFIGSIVFYAFAYNPGPSVRATDIGALPHTKWPMVASVGIEEIVQKLQMKNGKDWSVDRRVHAVKGLDQLRKQRADLERANRERDTVEDAAAKAASDAADAADESELKKTLDAAKAKDGTAPGAAGVAPAAEATETAPSEAIPVATPVQAAPAGPQQNQTGGQR